jgi:disulfide bond formation protein DsbB
MKSSKSMFMFVFLGSVILLGAALYLQLVEKMLPCPLCVLQRYAFFLLAICALLGLFMPRGADKVGATAALLASFTGIGLAGWHLWIKAHPGLSCGIDPMETALNMLPPAKAIPLLFQADGLCTTIYPPVLGLSIPMWSMLWFVIFTIALLMVLVRRRS